MSDGDFRLLGPLTATVGGSPVPLQSGKARILLTSLLLRGNRLLSVEELIDRLWADTAPKGARNAVQTHVTRLRSALGEAGGLVRTRPGGYTMDVAPGTLDLDRFRDRIGKADQARAARDNTAEARELREGLALWRGTPFSDVQSDFLHAQEAPRLVEERLQAWERVVNVELALGRHTELTGELYALTEEYPLRERFWGQLMTALHRSDRQADALAAYQKLATLLREELGVDPSTSLRGLYQRVLADDQEHAPPRQEPPPSRPPTWVAPFQLPADIADFVGRGDLMARLRALATGAAGNRLAVPIAVLAGPPGAGKTALAVHFAHELRSEFPDGQLYVDLRGFSANPPLSATDALASFLRALGVAADEIPHDVNEQGALLRSRLSGRKVFMVLDNAASADQVRPLLPAEAGCAVVVTSRNNLHGLSALNGARLFGVEMVTVSEAKTILANVIGAERVASEPDAANEFVAACGLLPLGLRIASTNLATSTSRTIADYLRKLLPGKKLDALEIDGDGQAAVRAAFDLSYSALKPSPSRFFRRLSLIPGQEFDVLAAAAVNSVDHDDAERLLGQLAASNLIGRRAPDRFTFHDLIREFATERARDHETAAERDQALGELFAFYLGRAGSARDLLYPDAHTMTSPAAPSGPLWTDSADAMRWLDAEAENMVALICGPAAAGLEIWLLADALQMYLQRHRHDSIWLTAFTAALAAAERSGDLLAQAGMRRGLGQLHLHRTRYAEAEQHMTRAARLFHEAGDAVGEARAQTGIGAIAFETEQYDKAIEHYEVSLRLAVDDRDEAGQSNNLFDLGLALVHLGDTARGETMLERSYEMARALDLPYLRVRCRSILVMSALYRGELAAALRGFALALDGWHDVKDRMGVTETVRNLAETELAAGRPDLATELGQEALAQSRWIASPWHEVGSLVVLGRAALAVDDLGSAGRHLTLARRLAGDDDRLPYWNSALLQGFSAWQRRTGRPGEAIETAIAGTITSRPREQARALIELAAARLDTGDREGAIRDAGQACEIAAGHGYLLDHAHALQTLANCQEPAAAERSREQAAALLTQVRAGTEELAVEVVARIAALGDWWRGEDPADD
ncbi:BTAD domain-containing putative transcriptional regulator [Amycolatopsis sp. cg5]|uniref:AfsR/SARP family transcriptional regulator n=1 Tax=Amycolatopsis sp. cg5 TaxID=3238802 RepID=UPI0035254DB3